jgi:hypothetical protein
MDHVSLKVNLNNFKIILEAQIVQLIILLDKRTEIH